MSLAHAPFPTMRRFEDHGKNLLTYYVIKCNTKPTETGKLSRVNTFICYFMAVEYPLNVGFILGLFIMD